ncbi:ROK family glucokinase [Deferribacterales bacterium RsTz2092]
MVARYFVADVGGTAIKYAVMLSEATTSQIIAKPKIIQVAQPVAYRIVSSGKIATPKGYNELISALLGLIKTSDVDAVQVSLPGVYDKRTDELLFAPNLPSLTGKHVAKALSVSGKPIHIENDANMATLGEYILDKSNPKLRSMVLLTLGTGIGGGVVLNGELLTGDITYTELGHITLVSDGRLCGCGKRGCAEKYCTLPAITTDYKDLSGDDQCPASGDATSIGYVLDRLRAGDGNAKAAFEIFSTHLAHLIATTINVFAPEAVRIGGGVSELAEHYLPRTLKLLDELVFPPFRGRSKVAIARLRNDAALYGGAAWLSAFQL